MSVINCEDNPVSRPLLMLSSASG